MRKMPPQPKISSIPNRAASRKSEMSDTVLPRNLAGPSKEHIPNHAERRTAVTRDDVVKEGSEMGAEGAGGREENADE